jgi:hypothetical protein
MFLNIILAKLPKEKTVLKIGEILFSNQQNFENK